MPVESTQSSKSPLEPNERIAEALFGLIMVLTFTGSLSVAESGRPEVRAMLIGALGCNLAWGIIDAILYLMGCLSEHAKGIRALRALQKATTPEEGHRAVASVLPPIMAETLGSSEYESMRNKLLQLPKAPTRPRLRKQEWLGALAVFLWVFFITFPVALPFIFMHDVGRALRLSNAIAVTLLFLTGFAFGRIAEYHAWLTGLAMILLGGALVGITIALGG
jgi:VIT1/CCC1 family predicted Fe2+/Mn2+ transporter